MNPISDDPLDVKQNAQAVLRNIAGESLQIATPILALSGLLLILTAHLFPEPQSVGTLGLLTIVLTLPTLALRHMSHVAASAWLIAVCTLAIVLLAKWVASPVTLCLLLVPAALSSIFLGVPGAIIGSALLTTLVVSGCLPIASVTPEISAVVVAGIWINVSLLLLASRPLRGTILWSWFNYRESRAALDTARDTQLQLKEALKALGQANEQLVRLDRRTRALRQEAEEARRVKEQFVANVSHELRTPINMVLGFAGVIAKAPDMYGIKLPGALLADLDVILRNSQHLSELIDDILDLSRVETGRWALTREPVSLRELIEAATTAVRPLFESKQLYLRTEIANDLPTLSLDHTRIREVILNLLSNAGRATDEGGVTVRAFESAQRFSSK